MKCSVKVREFYRMNLQQKKQNPVISTKKGLTKSLSKKSITICRKCFKFVSCAINIQYFVVLLFMSFCWYRAEETFFSVADFFLWGLILFSVTETYFCRRILFLRHKLISLTETYLCDRNFVLTETCFSDRNL